MKRSLRIFLTTCLALCINQCRLDIGVNNSGSKDTNHETVIAAPSGLTAIAASSAQIDLTWTDNSTNETGFEIVRSTDGASDVTLNVNSNITSYNNTGLEASKEYTYRIRAVANDKYSGFSEPVSATTHAEPSTSPAAPTGLTANPISFDKITLAWSDNSDNENSFVIQRKTTGNFANYKTVNANVSTYTDINLTPSTGYTYRVYAANTAGNSDYTNEASGTTSALPPTSLITDHTCTNRHLLTNEAIAKAVANLKIYYGHTSHGSQLMEGLAWLKEFDTRFANTPSIHEQDGYYDLGNPDRTTWVTLTRTYLNNNTNTNVVMWSWCKGVTTASEDDINDYLSLMTTLEGEYPNVKFVYMTGHLDGTGISGNLNQRNEQIRNYCKTNNKILYDFADIESYDPDGLVNYMQMMCDDNCDYDSDGNGSRDKNWATIWQNANPGKWYNCYPAHTKPLNGNLKAYAAWHLWTVLAELMDSKK